MTAPPAVHDWRRLAWTAGCVAAALLGFEISLMRMLQVGSYHHFAFLVITAALLGFGASGSALLLFRPWMMARADAMLYALVLATGVCLPVSAAVVQRVPADAVVLPAVWGRQAAFWLLYWAVLLVPFWLGASVLGLALMTAGRAIAGVYAGNLIGSAVGAILAPLAMVMVPPAWLPAIMGGIALLGAIGARSAFRPAGLYALIASTAAVTVCLRVLPPDIRVDQFKDVAHLDRLAAQGAAERIADVYGPRAVIAAYQSDAFHDLPFLSIGAEPPAMTAIMVDGHRAGSLLDIRRIEDASVVDHTLMAFPYGLAPPRPRVLLLGEIGGSNIWLAARRDASSINVVQPHEDLFSLMRGALRPYGGLVFDLPAVRTTTAEPRHFVDQTSSRFDIIQLVTLESLAVGAGGLRGLGEDHLVTVEGITRCLSRLTDRGILAASRGIQTPPRDNLKLLATFVAALRRTGVASPERHVVIVRDFLGVCTLVRVLPWTPAEIDDVRRACRERQLTPVWFDGIRRDELNHPDELPLAPDGIGDWYHFAARQLFSSEADRFIDEWIFDIRPPTDNRPFFYDFCRLRSLRALRAAFGDTWMTRAELGFVFVLFAAGLASVVGAVLILLPLSLLREARGARGKSATVGFFAAIGLAYLILEMTYLSRLTHMVGDPVVAAAVTIGGFLFFSGMGSLTAHRIRGNGSMIRWGVFGGILVAGLIGVTASWHLAAFVESRAPVGRCLAAMAMIAPPAYLMGFPMPAALRQLDKTAPALVPWAWGINGFASVAAAPLATAIGMAWGFHVTAATGLLLYALAGWLFARLPGKSPLS